MQPKAHSLNKFLSALSALERSLGTVIDPADPRLAGDSPQSIWGGFFRLISPVIGAEASREFYYRFLERMRGRPAGALVQLGYSAAFFLEEFDTDTMILDEAIWRGIRETIEDASGEMNLITLTALMDQLLSRGLLQQ